MQQRELLRRCWYRALEEEVGLAIETDNQRALANDLYKLRQELADPALAGISVMQPNNGEVWLCKQPQSLGEDNADPTRITLEEGDDESL